MTEVLSKLVDAVFGEHGFDLVVAVGHHDVWDHVRNHYPHWSTEECRKNWLALFNSIGLGIVVVSLLFNFDSGLHLDVGQQLLQWVL